MNDSAHFSVTHFSVKYVYELCSSEKFVFPRYPNNTSWNNDVKSRYIESLMLNFPVHEFFLCVQGNAYEVLDGSVRVKTIYDFYEGKFALSNLTFQQTLHGLRYCDFDSLEREDLDTRHLRFVILSAANDQVKNDIWSRLNEKKRDT